MKLLKGIVVLILFLIVFRGFIFRFLVNYKETGNRVEVELYDEIIISILDSMSNNRIIDLEEIVEIANDITNAKLEFSLSSASRNPMT
ncbi:MAG: hypothetical protein ACI86M_003119 [Saprospiraceae bacterium]|jgi:hypothetical protein